MANDFLDNFGKLLVREIKKQILLMELVDTGDYLSSIGYDIKNGELYVYSDVDYAAELEYGTYEQKSASNEDFPSSATGAKAQKKKNMDPKTAKAMPKGMVPFAPFRRVLYNQRLLNQIANEAASTK